MSSFGDTLAPGQVQWQLLQGRAVPQSGGADQIWLGFEGLVCMLPMQCQRCLMSRAGDGAGRALIFVLWPTRLLRRQLDDEAEEDMLGHQPRF